MTDIFTEDVPDSAFELPGDDKLIAAGREASGQDPPATEPAEEVATEPAVELAAVDELEAIDEESVASLLAKYGGDVQKALRGAVAAQRKLGDQSREVGQSRQEAEQSRQELAEMREMLDRRFAKLDQELERPDPVPMEAFDDLIDENPAQAAEFAWRAGNQAALQRALVAWDEVSPGSPRMWVQMLQQQEQLNRLAQETDNAHWGRSFQALETQFPDLRSYVQQMGEVAPRYPGLLSELQNGTPEGRTAAFEALYRITKSITQDSLGQAAGDVARSALEAEERARSEAAVTAATRTVPQARKSSAELVGEQWAEMDKPFSDGWNV